MDKETLDQPPTPSCSKEIDDCRIRCSDHKSLYDITKVVVAQISKLADSAVADREDFVAQFKKFFMSALQENIVVNDFPLEIDSSKLMSSESEDEKQNNEQLAKLSRAISKTAHKRKYYSSKCCRIMKQKMKHELQNVKRAKVIDSHQPYIFSEDLKKRDTKLFNEFCAEFKSIQETVQVETKERDKLEKKISLASDILRSQKRPS